MKQKCLGCKEECEMEFIRLMTGCAYEDSIYPKDARIWYVRSLLDSEEHLQKAKNLIKKQYPKEWELEKH